MPRQKDTHIKLRYHPTLILPEGHPLIPLLEEAKEEGRLAQFIIDGLMRGGVVVDAVEEKYEVNASSLIVF